MVRPIKSFDQPLYILDLNIDRSRMYYGTKSGALVKVAQQVCVNAKLSPDERREVLLRNAARIATKAVDGAVLAGSSAYHRGAVEGHLALATPWGGKPIDVGGAFTIFQSRSYTDIDIGLNREIEHVEVHDDFGSITVKRMSDELLIVKNFQYQKGRPKSTYLNVTDLAAVVERSSRSLGGREQLMGRLDALMRLHGLHAYREKIVDFISMAGSYTQLQRPLRSFRLYWHRTPVATLVHDGHIWSFDYEPGVKLKLSVTEKVGKRSVPSFLGSLLPETGRHADGAVEERLEAFQLAHRYISNISVHPLGTSSKSLIVDTLDGELPKFRSQRLEFNGSLNRELHRDAVDDLKLMQLRDDPDMPRISGMQVKLAAHLDSRGTLTPAIDKSFTHILKVPGGQGDFSTLGSMEWFSLTIAKLCRLNVEEFALVELQGRGPALLVERFDVRRDLNDRRMMLTEDFWSAAGMSHNDHKYKGELMDVADILLKHSTDPVADGKSLLSQAIFSWLTFNGDMHLKNLLMLKEAKDIGEGFSCVRLSPAFDILCTQVYPNDAKSSAIALCGSRQHTLAGFRALGKKFGISVDEVDKMVDYLVTAVPLWAQRVAEQLPPAIQAHELSMQHIKKAVSLFDVRCMMMLAELDGAAKRSSPRTADEDAEEAVASFSADGVGDSITEHIEAERRRSWIAPGGGGAPSRQAAVPAANRAAP